jgi:hypothetical protein
VSPDALKREISRRMDFWRKQIGRDGMHPRDSHVAAQAALWSLLQWVEEQERKAPPVGANGELRLLEPDRDPLTGFAYGTDGWEA